MRNEKPDSRPFQDCASQALIEDKAQQLLASLEHANNIAAHERRIQYLLLMEHTRLLALGLPDLPVKEVCAQPMVHTHKGKRIAKWKLDRNPHLRHRR